MPNYLTPGIYVEEVATGPRPIQAVGTSTAGFIGVAPKADQNTQKAVAITNFQQFANMFDPDATLSTPLSQAVFGFFRNGGSMCYVVNIGTDKSIGGGGSKRKGIDLFEEIDEIALVAAPGYTDAASYDIVLSHCEKLKDRFAILDAPATVSSLNALTKVGSAKPPAPATPAPATPAPAVSDDGSGARARQSDGGYGAFYFPWLISADPNDATKTIKMPPSGHIAGICARTDAARGVHKAPANESVRGAIGLTYNVTPQEQADLNSAGVNCIRTFPTGIRVWGARTLSGKGSEWTYVNVRRLFNMIEESIAESTNWVVFEPNNEMLWQAIKRDVSAFLSRLWRDGALKGETEQEAFFVKCNAETNPPEVVNAGMVVTVIGVAPVKPAEFVVFRIGQSQAGPEVTAVK